jgi:hypothetical protein
MTRGPVSWTRALRATVVALALFAGLAFAAGNFVLVEVHVFTLAFQARLAWVVLVPAGLMLALGWRLGHARALAVPRDDGGERQAEVRDPAR